MSDPNFQIISQEHLNMFLKRLEEIQRQVEALDPESYQFVDNTKFLQLMGISKRTAQSWRDQGLITYSQIGGKIYYTRDDIHDFLDKNRKDSF